MATLYKAMTRNAVMGALGVPIKPFFVAMALIVVLGANFTPLLYLLAVPTLIIMRRMTREDERIFDIVALKFKTRGKPALNRHYSAVTYTAADYDDVDITEFINRMNLNERAPLEKLIPYSSHVTPHIVKNRHLDFVASWEIIGMAWECQDDRDLDIIAAQLNNLYRSFEGQPVTFYVHRPRTDYHDSLSTLSGNPFSDEVNRLYYDGIKNTRFYRDRLFFTVCYQPFTSQEDKTGLKMMNAGDKRRRLDASIAEMEEIRGSVAASLARYHATALGAQEQNGGVYSSQLSLYQFLLTGHWQKVKLSRSPFYELLGGVDVFFSSDAGQVNTPNGNRYFRSIEIKDFCEQTSTGMMDALMYFPVHYVLTNSFTTMAKSEAQAAIKRKLKDLNAAEDDAQSQQEDLGILQDLVTGGVVSAGKHHYSLMVYADSPEQLQTQTNQIVTLLQDMGLIVTLSTLSLAAAFFAQLPGNYALRPRLSMITSQNFADLESLHNYMAGKKQDVPWQEPLMLLKASGGGDYALNLHNTLMGAKDFNRKTLANTGIIGGSGAGKTVLLSAMANAMQKFSNPATFSPQTKTQRLTTVFFDKDRATEINIRAMGGEYFTLENGKPTGWNPLMLESTKRNIVFIKQLLKILCTRNNNTLTTREEQRLNHAVDAVMRRPKEHRKYGITRVLENISEPSTNEARENGLKIRLAQWQQGGEFGWVFDNENDDFDLNQNDIFGFDGTEFLGNADVCPPITYYLLYRVTSLLDGRRMVIFMDEFWQWIEDTSFIKFVYNLLKTIRKLNGIVILATQSPRELINSEIFAAIREQVATWLFLANPKAEKEEYVDGLKVPAHYFTQIKAIDPLSRQFLVVKSPLYKGDTHDFAAMVSLDLSGLGNLTKVLSADKDNLEIFESIYQTGMTPQEWLPQYLEQAL